MTAREPGTPDEPGTAGVPADGMPPDEGTDATVSPATQPDDDARDLLGAYALDALDDDERQAVERLVARDPSAAQEARELLATAELLGAAVAGAPPADLRAATLALVARTPQLPATGPGSVQGGHVATSAAPASRVPAGSTGPASARGSRGPAAAHGTADAGPRRRRRVWIAALAAVVAVAVAVPSTLAWQESRRAADAEARADRITSLLTSPDARVVTAPVSTGGSAVAVITTDAALVSAQGVADPGAGHVYQLWVMRDGTPLPDGTARVSDGAIEVYTQAYRAGDALALTVEPAGGSTAPTTDPVVLLAPS